MLREDILKLFKLLKLSKEEKKITAPKKNRMAFILFP